MFQVIHKQQRIIRKQDKVIQTLGGEFEDFDSMEFVSRLSKLKKAKEIHDKYEESDEVTTPSSLHDSALDESGKDSSQRTKETEKQSDNQDISDVPNDDENSDSYITMQMHRLLILMMKQKMTRLKKKKYRSPEVLE